MLKVQESMLRALFDSFVKSLTVRVDGVVESVNSLKASLEFSQKDIEELKPLASKLEEAKDEIDQLNSDLAQQELKAEYLENQSRRNNICIFPNWTACSPITYTNCIVVDCNNAVNCNTCHYRNCTTCSKCF